MKFILRGLIALAFGQGALSRINKEENDPPKEMVGSVEARNRLLEYTAFQKGEIVIKPLPLAPPGNESSTAEGIDFEGEIGYCDATPNRGAVPFRSLGNPDVWDYWSIELQAGRSVAIEGLRESCGMDPAFYLFFNSGVIVGSGDDELPPPDYCKTGSPFADPRLEITALPFTGKYVIGLFDNAGEPAVVNGQEEKEGRYKLRVTSPDRDGDGIGEACDKCPFTDLQKYVPILGRPSTVKDQRGKDGCSLSDLTPGILKACDKRATSAQPDNPVKFKEVFGKCVNKRFKRIQNNYDNFSKNERKKMVAEAAKFKEQDFLTLRNMCGNRFFAADKDNLFIIDPVSGEKQFVGRVPGCSAEIEFDEQLGDIWNEKCGGSVLTRVNAMEAPAVTKTLPDHERGPVSGMELVGGVMYGIHVPRKVKPRLSKLVKINRWNSRFEVIGATDKESIPGLAYDGKENIMWGITGGNSPTELVTVDLETGKANLTSIVRPSFDLKLSMNNVGSLDFGPDGELYAGTNERAEIWPNTLIKINRRTGVAEKLGATEIGYRGLACYTLPV